MVFIISGSQIIVSFIVFPWAVLHMLWHLFGSMHRQPNLSRISCVITSTTLKILHTKNVVMFFSYTTRTLSATVSVQIPFGFSPHVITDINVQLLKPSEDSSSFLGASSSTLVPSIDFRFEHIIKRYFQFT